MSAAFAFWIWRMNTFSVTGVGMSISLMTSRILAMFISVSVTRIELERS